LAVEAKGTQVTDETVGDVRASRGCAEYGHAPRFEESSEIGWRPSRALGSGDFGAGDKPRIDNPCGIGGRDHWIEINFAQGEGIVEQETFGSSHGHDDVDEPVHGDGGTATSTVQKCARVQ